MTDTVDPVKRSSIMASVPAKGSKAELTVRRALHAAGLRFRLHREDLPGRPDIVLSRRRTVVFVHGCFWHRHPGCRRASTPATNQEYWVPKFARNRARDAAVTAALQQLGWRVEVVWECQCRPNDLEGLIAKLKQSG